MINKFLIIQTAFIGDVILATPVIEKLHQYFPESKIDFLLRKGNENLLTNHPYLNALIICRDVNRTPVFKKDLFKLRNIYSNCCTKNRTNVLEGCEFEKPLNKTKYYWK